MRSLLCACTCLLVAQSSAWSWYISGASSPGPRVSGHACAASTDRDNILLYGGLTGSAGSSTTNDLWVYGGGEWDLLPRKTQGVSRPGKRMYAASTVLGRWFYLFGGLEPGEPGSEGKSLDDIWRLSLDTNKWDRSQASMPYGVSRHSACAVGTDAIVIHTHKGVLLYANDGRDWSVKEQPTTGDGPENLSICARASICDDETGRQNLVVFGWLQEQSLDAFVLDTKSWKWRKLLLKDQQGDCPGPIVSPCAVSVGGGNQCIIFGGASLGEEGYAGGLIPKDDTWLLTVNGDFAEWEKVAVGGNSPEGRVAASFTAVGGDVVLQGGWNPVSKETYGDQTWILKE